MEPIEAREKKQTRNSRFESDRHFVLRTGGKTEEGRPRLRRRKEKPRGTVRGTY
jgi:hypothetical protein